MIIYDYDIIIVASNTAMKHNRQPSSQLPCGHVFFFGGVRRELGNANPHVWY